MATPNPAFFGCDRFGLTAPVDVRLTPSFSSPVTGSNAGCTLVDRVGGSVELQRRVPAGNAGAIEGIEHVGADLDVPAAGQPDIPRNRQIEDLREASAEIVGARLEADAADLRPGERGRVELAVEILAAACTGIAE